jgi:hypothetical protein
MNEEKSEVRSQKAEVKAEQLLQDACHPEWSRSSGVAKDLRLELAQRVSQTAPLLHSDLTLLTLPQRIDLLSAAVRSTLLLSHFLTRGAPCQFQP